MGFVRHERVNLLKENYMQRIYAEGKLTLHNIYTESKRFYTEFYFILVLAMFITSIRNINILKGFQKHLFKKLSKDFKIYLHKENSNIFRTFSKSIKLYLLLLQCQYKLKLFFCNW